MQNVPNGSYFQGAELQVKIAENCEVVKFRKSIDVHGDTISNPLLWVGVGSPFPWFTFTREAVARILPVLQRFAETGELTSQESETANEYY